MEGSIVVETITSLHRSTDGSEKRHTKKKNCKERQEKWEMLAKPLSCHYMKY